MFGSYCLLTGIQISLVDVGPDSYQTILQAADQYSINGAKDAVVIELAKEKNNFINRFTSF